MRGFIDFSGVDLALALPVETWYTYVWYRKNVAVQQVGAHLACLYGISRI